MKKKIAILGSTGSIGTQALEVIDANSEYFGIEVITANNNADLLIKQAIKYEPNAVVIANENKYKYVSDALAHLPIKVYAGEKAVCQIVEINEIDQVLTALVGFSGLIPTINAIKAKKHIALANKETLVVAGEIITNLAIDNNIYIIPVDSEHSAIFQCLAGEKAATIEKIYLTASGGPFRLKSKEELESVTKSNALEHPTWTMGNKVTIDSASLMNKGLEVIEAKWFFNLKPDQISVVVHPQSIVHSLVQFCDGSIKAQIGLPDMKLPIQYALSYPDRIKSNFRRFDFTEYPNLSFEQPDLKKFRNLALAYDALNKGGNMPCILNAANEIVVEAFINEKCGFYRMSDIIEKTLDKIKYISKPTIEDLLFTNAESREYAKSLI
ncbi:MAG: 1-deoxy-D-xylulose-5-phosphate reductoisomerase [Bacteroidota bacterium]